MKGNVYTMFWLMVAFMFLGIIIILAVYLKDQIFPQIIDFVGNGTEAESIMNTSGQIFNLMDNIFMLLYFLIASASVILAAMVRTNPAYFVVNVILILILFLIAPAMSNVMQEFWSSPEFAPYAAGGGGSVTFPIMTGIFRYLPHITVGISVIVMLATFSKGFGSGEM